MYIQAFRVNLIEVNCYVAHDDTGEGVIIDCGCSAESEWKAIKEYIDEHKIDVKHLLCTHLHFDHVWGNAMVKRDLGLNPEGSKEDLSLYENIEDMISSFFHMQLPMPDMPPMEHFLKDGDTVTFGNTTLEVISTPGHTYGSLCFYSEKDEVLFSGDTLFCGSIGRTDLEGGNMDEMQKSLRKLMLLPKSTNVLCGHGPYTTIEHEQQYNPMIYSLRRS